MSAVLSIDCETGCICIGNFAMLTSGVAKSTVEQQVGALLVGSRDHGNGYEWLYLSGMTFGGQPVFLSLCFLCGLLDHMAWNVNLPDAPMEGGWPTREAIDSEVSFVREVLLRDMGIEPGQQPWGELWSLFDARGFLASNGLRYGCASNA